MEIPNKDLIWITSDSNKTGVPVFTLNFFKNLDNNIINRIAVVPAGWLRDELETSGILTFRLEISIRNLFKLRRIFLNHPDAILHFQGSRAGVFGIMASTFLKNRKFYTEHNWTHDYRLKQNFRKPFQMIVLRLLLRNVEKIIA